MKIVTITNHKGGTAKTTTAVSLAGALAEVGHPVLVIDLDPQGSATRWLHGPTNNDAGRLVAPQYDDRPRRALTGEIDLADAIIETEHDGIHLLPANATLEQAARELATEPGGDAILRALLSNGLDPQHYHYVLIDTPPAAGTLSSSALLAADLLVIPVEARHLALEGLARILTTIKRLALRLEREVPIAALLLCRLDRRNKDSPRIAEHVTDFVRQAQPGLPIHEIRENVTLSVAAAHHQPITSYDGRSTGAEDYRKVTRDLVKRFKP
ncbi:MAG: ParA family protein [bacterium]